jgi:hypothetical protein
MKRAANFVDQKVSKIFVPFESVLIFDGWGHICLQFQKAVYKSSGEL